jgi:hypothetical protein
MAPKQSTPKKSAAPHPLKVKRSPVVGPILGTQTWVNKVHTAPTKADGVFVTWASKGSVASYTNPFKKHFEDNGIAFNLTKAWKVNAIVPRRDFKDPDANAKLPGSPDKLWGWDSFVTVIDENEDETAATIGKHITEKLSEFAASAKQFKNQLHPPKYAFSGVPSDSEVEGLKPLSHYLLDENVAAVFKEMYGQHEKDVIMEQDDLLIGFFGSAQKGREVLEKAIW